jgi:hypothetical protein
MMMTLMMTPDPSGGRDHAKGPADKPLFLYLAYQAVHGQSRLISVWCTVSVSSVLYRSHISVS